MKLSLYQKIMLFLLVLILIVFSVLYYNTLTREGYKYHGKLLVVSYEEGRTLYTGQIDEKQAQFIVTKDNVITFTWGDKAYGPYVIKEDPASLPVRLKTLNGIGIQIIYKDQCIFRGGFIKTPESELNSNYLIGNSYKMYIKDGTRFSVHSEIDPNITDWVAPSLYHLLDLYVGPELIHNGDPSCWFVGLILLIGAALSVLFADALFRLRISLSDDEFDQVSPSVWEYSLRHIIRIALISSAILVFILGLWYRN